ncbi:conserved exported hypothetical protein [uncultured Dysgonomonas sp.]|uniref:Uncharacterized protein n=1 Tax=uncultured Dysgonomonas sp. TaxID=206096 RepID=A0A212K6G1_9BACT|nr:hypothetical protein [uncultured Dysgonomonas sp.]SBW07095.1 conserved exported hypothetical protein [uncultured Dysgonomonas sp.]
MNLSKYIILVLIASLLPFLAYAQKKGNKYIVTTKDTTLIVSNRGEKDPQNKFLFNKMGADADSVSAILKSDYNSLEGALMDIDRLIGQIEKDQILLKTGNTSLAYRLSRANIDSRDKEKRARIIADSIQQEMLKKSADELAQEYVKYGNKPLYFINGTRVQSEVVDRISPNDVVKRDFIIQNTASGNPNGEVWITVTDKAINKLNLWATEKSSDNYVYPSPITPTMDTKTTDRKEEKAPKRSVRRIKTDRAEQYNDNQQTVTSPVYQSEPTTTEQKTNNPAQQPTQGAADKNIKTKKDNTSVLSGDRRTIVRARTVNNEEVKVNEPEGNTENQSN